MQNAPEEPVTVEATFNSIPPFTVTLQTETDGNIQTQGLEVSGDWSTIETSFENCIGIFTTQIWVDSLFVNLVDIPFFLDYCPDTTTAVYGCTDSSALNYNPQANNDDGSCEYETDCALNLLSVIINTENWANEISWSINLSSIIIRRFRFP